MSTIVLACLLAQLGTVSRLSAPPGLEIEDARVVSLDGDDRRDLVLSLAPADESEGRRLHVHLARDGESRFAGTADASLAVARDVVAWAVADVHADNGSELVLFTASGAFAWRPRVKAEGDRFVRLFDVEFLWQVPRGDEVWSWQEGVHDLDGDGLSDLLVPVPDGYMMAFQERTGAAVSWRLQRLRVPYEPNPWDISPISVPAASRAERGRRQGEVSMGRRRFNLRLADERRAPLVRFRESCPAPTVLDWDGDGDLDVLAQGRQFLFLWQQAEDGFPAQPGGRFDLPVVRNQGGNFDVSYSTQAMHLDADGRADCLVVAGDKRSDDIRTQVLVFRQDPRDAAGLFGDQGRPSQLLVLAGFVDTPRHLDVDGDGLEDLVVGALRPDLIDGLRAASSKSIDIELHWFRNTGGQFTRRPAFSTELSIPVGDGDYRARFFGDVTGDGMSELVMRDAPDRLLVLWFRKQRDEYTLIDRPLLELEIPSEGRLLIVPAANGHAPELLVRDTDRVLHVSFP